MTQLRCSNGVPSQHGLDRLTKARLTYALACIEHLTSIKASASGTVRAAIALYVEKLDGLLDLPKDSFEVENLAYNLRTAHRGNSSAWENFPALNHNLSPFPTFAELLNTYRAEVTRKDMEFLKRPMYERK